MKKFLILLLVLIPQISFAGVGNLSGFDNFTGKLLLRYEGLTTLSYDGDDAGSYVNANALCVADFASSHVCSAEEILGLINQGSNFDGETANAWINAGHTGYPLVLSNDCNAWSTAAGAYGNYFDFTQRIPLMAPCDVTGAFTLQFACCR